MQTVYDHDTFTVEDKMGSATTDIKQFLDSVTLHLENLPNGTLISKVPPTVENWLADESSIVWNDGKIVQDMSLRLRNVERGAVEGELIFLFIKLLVCKGVFGSFKLRNADCLAINSKTIDSLQDGMREY